MFLAFLLVIVLISLLAYTLLAVRRRAGQTTRPDALKRAVRSRPLPDDTDRYRCPVHPHVRHGSPGRCPNCGQDLVRPGDSSPGRTRRE